MFDASERRAAQRNGTDVRIAASTHPLAQERLVAIQDEQIITEQNMPEVAVVRSGFAEVLKTIYSVTELGHIR